MGEYRQEQAELELRVLVSKIDIAMYEVSLWANRWKEELGEKEVEHLEEMIIEKRR